MSNDTTLDALNDSSTNKATLLTEADSTLHCPGCLCTNRRLYCDGCMQNKRSIAKNRRQKLALAGVYTILVAIISAAISNQFYERCENKEEPSYFSQWMNFLDQLYTNQEGQ